MIFSEGIKALIAAIGIGLMIGVVRERHYTHQIAPAGIRTHTLIAILGSISWSLGMIPFALTMSIIGAFTVTSYLKTAAKDPGLTGEVAMIITFVLAAMARENTPVAAALAVLCSILIQAKLTIHRFSKEIISEQEISDALLILASALIVLPLLPNKSIDPWGAVNFTTIWRIVILIMATGMFSHVANRILGPRLGLPISGFFSGFISSTATVVSLGQKIKQNDKHVASIGASALLANLSSLLLIFAILGTVSTQLLNAVLFPLCFAAAGLISIILVLLVKYKAFDESMQLKSSNVFKLSHAFLMALIFTSVTLLSAWLNNLFGNIGAIITAILVALTEVHAAAASLGQLVSNDAADLRIVQWGIIGILSSSTLSKMALAYFSGGARYCLVISLGLWSMVIGSVCGMILF